MNVRRPFRVLFLCTGNSCRSQMAKGWVNALGGGRVTATSAGIEAHGQNARAVAVMREVGIDIGGQASKTVTPEMVNAADMVVTVCGHADEHCPILPPYARKQHWPLEDPARARGAEAEILETFRATRDEIRRRVERLLAEIASESA